MWNVRALLARAVPKRKSPQPLPERKPRASIGPVGRILVAEDEYLVGMAIEHALLDAGHEVADVVTTGEDALREARRLRPDLVLMDIRLAGVISGIEAAVQLRALGITSLFISANSDPATRLAGAEARPIGWLPKPFAPSEVVSAVATALAQLRGG